MSGDSPILGPITTLFRYDTEFSADSVEWCPHEPFKNYFVCANYHLVEPQNNSDRTTRLGRILLFSITPATGLNLVQTVDTAAVLDQKWCHQLIDNSPILGVVNALNTLQIYRLNSTNKLELLTEFIINEGLPDSETLLLSLDWSTGKYESDGGPQIICSDSKGNAHLFRFNAEKLVLETTWHCHEFEAWICAFYYWDPHIVFTGGDDSVFLKFDLRVGTGAVAKNRGHEAGVTAMHSNAAREFCFVTGSYDSKVRLWDIRHLKVPKTTLEMPGTLWRLKWDPFERSHILAACMLGGVHIIDARNDDNLEIVQSYDEHKNIAYGADWCHLHNDEEIKQFEGEGNVIIGTCSFYDHLLCVSKFNLPIITRES